MRRRTVYLRSEFALEERCVPAIINFALTTATSSLTLSGTIGGAAIQQQGTGSLTTTYSGTAQVDVDFNAGTIQAIKAGTSVAASINGNWAPLAGGATGTAPADYGAKASIPILPPFVFVTALIALRDVVGTMESTPQTLSGAGATKTFSPNSTFTITAGAADYSAGSLGTGTQPLTGSTGTNAAATQGSFTDNGDGTYKLALPIDVTINDTVSGQPAVYNIKGTFNATAILPVADLNGVPAGNDSSWTFQAGSPPVAIAPAAILTRNPAANLSGMTVKLAAPPDGAAESLAVDLTSTGLTTTGYDPATGILSVSGSGSLATYQSALQKVMYAHAAGTTTAGARAITVSVSDGTNTSLVRMAAGTVTVPPPKVLPIVINNGDQQRSRVTSLKVNFDQAVNLPADPNVAFQLVRNGDSMGVTLSSNMPSNPTNSITLSFTGGAVDSNSLADGRYTLTIVAAQVTGSGGTLDGNGDGTGGDNYVLASDPTPNPPTNIFRIFGDVNGDGAVGVNDFALFRQSYNGVNDIFDFDGDGFVSTSDFSQFRQRFNSSI
jgi:hypothetical protein